MKQERELIFLREPAVFKKTGISRATRWRLEKDGDFPKKIRISPGAIAWLEHEIDEWIKSRSSS